MDNGLSVEHQNGRQEGPAQLCVANRPASKWPPPRITWSPPRSWHLHRGTITRLYIDENRKLQDVMTIMVKDYAHRGTIKMYKSRITQWGLRKNRKSRSSARTFIKKERQQNRSKPILSDWSNWPELTELAVFLDDKNLSWIRPMPTSTPVCSSVLPSRCSTELSMASLLTDHECLQGYPEEPHLDESLKDCICSIARPADVSPATLSEVPFLVCSTNIPNDSSSATLKQTLGHHYRGTASVLPSVILPPSTLLDQERLFSCISTYFDGSFSCGTWEIRDDEASVSVGASGIVNNDPYIFYNYCRTASQLIHQGFRIQAIHLLSSACGLVRKILLAGDYHTLSRLLDSLMYLEDSKLGGIAAQLQDYIHDMATCILPRQHPWYHICKLIMRADVKVQRPFLTQSWQCATDALERASGKLSTATIQCQVELFNRAYGNEDPLTAEHILRGLLAQCRESHNSDIVCLKVLVVLGYNLIDQQKSMQAEQIAQKVLQRSPNAGRWSHAYRLEAYELAAWAQYYQGKQQLAEHNQRMAIAGHINQWGRDVTVLRRMVMLESWLRDWGRVVEAQALSGEVLDLIGSDDNTNM